MKLRVVLGVAYLAVQLVVPVVMWATQPHPAPFAWAMYSAAPASPHIEVVFEDGTRRQVPLTDEVVRTRAEIPYAEVLPAHLCRVMQGVVAVDVDDVEVLCGG